MRVLLIYFSVNMILSFVESLNEEDIQDLSDWCIHDRILYFYLTTGIGQSDISVGMIVGEKNLNCTVIYSVKSKQNIMLVLEFPDLKPHENICVLEKNNSVTVSGKVCLRYKIFIVTPRDRGSTYAAKQTKINDPKAEKTCHFSGTQLSYSKMSQEKVAIHFKSGQKISTIKIIATSMKYSQDSKCSGKNEIECWTKGKIFCMSSMVACDGHNNCGTPDMYDEDKKICEKRHLTFLMILSSIIMGILSLCLFSSLWMTFLPKRKETFVYKFDQRMPLFDSEGGIIDADIEIKILFPNETQNKPKK